MKCVYIVLSELKSLELFLMMNINQDKCDLQREW
jgi:hypothetical protein